ncbi:MAG: methylmalonyl-CoA carboxyltransferase, partial [Acidimicrobiia bacterium]|nr:methylmalonyl-CoA carboxyltransferase [Acidimicrobiia bacterium]
GVAALHGWGLAAKAIAKCSGYVPIITVVTGPAVSGPALLIGLSDIVIMTNESYAFVSGPTMVAEFTGVVISNDELGGSDIHAKQSGVAHLVVADRQTAFAEVEHVLSFLPDNVNEIATPTSTTDSIDRLTPEAGALIPETPTGAYDVKAVIRSIADDGYLLELRERWAPNIVTGLITIGAQSVGVVANQPMNLAGTLDIPASQKAARFVAFCDAFNIPTS